MVERFYCQMKSSLMASTQRDNSSRALPLIFLRSTLNEDLHHSLVELSSTT